MGRGGNRDSFRLWVQCFYPYCMFIMIACMHWPDHVWLKSSLTLFAIIPQFGAQEVTCTCHKGAKQINASEHKRRLFKDPPKDSYFVHLGTVSVQQNSLILSNCPLVVEGWARPPYVLRDWHRDASLQAVTQGTWSRSELSAREYLAAVVSFLLLSSTILSRGGNCITYPLIHSSQYPQEECGWQMLLPHCSRWETWRHSLDIFHVSGSQCSSGLPLGRAPGTRPCLYHAMQQISHSAVTCPLEPRLRNLQPILLKSVQSKRLPLPNNRKHILSHAGIDFPKTLWRESIEIERSM